MLAHKAVHEAHVAAEVAAGEKTAFDARVIPSVAYTDPEVAWVGVTEDEAKARGLKVKKGLFPGRPRAAPSPTAATRLHQAAVRRGDAPHRRRRHRRHACRRHDRRGGAGHRDGRRRGGHRQDHPPAPDAGRSIGLAAEAFEGRAPTFRRCASRGSARRRCVARHALGACVEGRAVGVVADLGHRRRAARGRVVAGRPAGGFVGGLVGARDAQRRAEAVRRRLRAREGQREVVLGVRVGAPRGVDLVLGVEQVQQAALADVELLAVGVARPRWPACCAPGRPAARSACACRCRRSPPPGGCRGRRGRARRRPVQQVLLLVHARCRSRR